MNNHLTKEQLEACYRMTDTEIAVFVIELIVDYAAKIDRADFADEAEAGKAAYELTCQIIEAVRVQSITDQ